MNWKNILKKVIYYLLLVVFASVFIFSAVVLGKYFYDSYQNQMFYNNLASQYSRPSFTIPTPQPTQEDTVPVITLPRPTDTRPLPTIPTIPEPTEPRDIRPEILPIYEQNNHTVGWIYIPGTKVDYPVVQTPNTAQWRDYYLYRSFDGKSDKRGTIYVRETCDVNVPSDNITIYGHLMNDETMFGSLWHYAWNQSYYEEHRYIQFDTLYETHVYEIFAIFHTEGVPGKGFAYHRFDYAKNEEDFNEFVTTCLKLSEIKSGITPVYGDKLITLSTCDYSGKYEDGRFVLVAKRIS